VSRRLLAILTAATIAAPTLAAQAATTTWNVRFSIPDSLQGRTMGVGEVDARFIVATDGNSVAMQAEPGPMSSLNGGSGFRLHVILPAAGDSVHLGVVMPPELAAQMGGGVGWRLSLAIPDSLPIPILDPDSLLNEELPRTERVGTTDVVGGISCNNWLLYSKPDSNGVAQPPATICVASTVPALKNIGSALERLLPQLMYGIEKWADSNRRMFGSSDVTLVSYSAGDDAPMMVQLESASETAPDASFFVLPPGLEPLPPELLMMFTQAASQESGQ
jgi:hypothetical protein